MKPPLFVIGAIAVVLLTACTPTSIDANTPDDSMMMNMPCHQMPDGSWMGDCQADPADAMMMGMPCHQMPDGSMMGDCGEEHMSISESEMLSQDTDGLPEVVPTEVVELEDGEDYTITAEIVQKDINGTPVRMLAYNRQIPGPTLKVSQGSKVNIKLVNEIDIPTLFHSHGLRLENRYDGTHLTQDPIEIGGNFEYKLSFPDAGVYWYHPHLREDYTQESGLYGNFLVVPSDEGYWSPVDQEEMLVLDDLSIGPNGQLEKFFMDYGTKNLMGRFGNQYFTNGSINGELELRKGNTARLFITNVANTRTFNLQFPGADIKKVGADASKYEREELVSDFIVAPSERVVVEIRYPEEGAFEIFNATPGKQDSIGTVQVRAQSTESIADFDTLRTNDDIANDIDPFRQYFDKAPDKELTLTVDLDGMMNMDHSAMGHSMGGMMEHSESDDQHFVGIEWEDEMPMMNNMSTSENVAWNIVDTESGKENMEIDWKFQKGDVVKIRLFNDPNSEHPMQHPFHIHGQRFLVLERNGVRNDNLAWKDTTLIRTGETVDVLVEMSNPGKWMAHCHIAEHLEAGMMMGFEVLL